jgi:hypothetical protein
MDSRRHIQEAVMLFLTISTPRPDRPSEVRTSQQQFWSWMDALLERGTARFCYARAGWGFVALFEIDGNESLHRLLNEWTEIIPAEIAVYPLLEAAVARRFLAGEL